jgi:L-2,4-diaminobutyrate transaminase
MLTNDTLAQWDRDSLFHPSTHLAQFARGEAPQRIMAGGKGCMVVDRDGNRLLDGFAGLYCVNVGYGRQEIAEAIAAQARELAYFHAYAGHGTEVGIRLAKMVMDRAPEGMARVYFGLGGSDANETNVKLVWYARNIEGKPQKKKIISRMRGYHGSGIVSGSMTGLTLFHQKFDLPIPQVVHTHAPYFYRRPEADMTEAQFTQWLLEELEALILREGPDTIAAMIGEPVLGTGGIVPPPAGYWEGVQAILAKYDIWLIVDEVVTGFGRLGQMFGSTVHGLKPDLITIAKGLTSAYAPMSGSIVGGRIWDILMQGTDENGIFGHGWTYSAHPIGAAAGIANLELLDRLDLVRNTAEVGPYLLAAMRAAVGDHANVGEVRGQGLLCAVELVSDRANRAGFSPPGSACAKVVAAMGKRGVIARVMPQGDIIGFAPPLCLSRDEADTLARVTAEAIAEVFA